MPRWRGWSARPSSPLPRPGIRCVCSTPWPSPSSAGSCSSLFWLFRLAFLANFLSRAVMAGFISGLGIEVFTNQVRKILAAPHVADAASGVLMAAEHLKEAMASSVNTEGYFVEVIALIHSIPRANLYSVAIGVSAFLIVRLIKRYAPRIPGALVALVLLTTIVAVFDLAAKGVGVLGAIPSGAPTLTLPQIPAADYLRLLPSALAIVAILLCEGLLVVRSYSNNYGTKRTAIRCCSPTGRPTWRPASPDRC